MRGAIAPHRLEEDDASVRAELEAVLGERGAEQIAAERFTAGAIVGSDPAMGGEIEAIARGLARAARGGVTAVGLGPEPADAGPGPWPQREAARDGGAHEARPKRGRLRERVGR